MTYAELAARYGNDMAFDLLLIIERIAKIRQDIEGLNEEARLRTALAVLDKQELRKEDSL